MNSEPVGEFHEPWGTQEELLLAYAVNRYGDHSWDSVATEIHSRIPRFHLLTPFHFQHKFLDLNRRFLHLDPHNTGLIPWIHHLRQLRVSELRLEVQNYDTSITSLQSKLRKLEQESERMIRDSETIPDLKIRISGGSNPRVSDEQRSDPETDADNTAPANQDDQSFNESNSAHTRSDNVGVPVRSSEKEGIAEELREQEEAAPVTETESSTDVSFFDTVVQMKSRPLDEIFVALSTHPLCSVFSRQLDDQERERYARLIREPIDLAIIRERVEQGSYNFCRSNFFRDTCLLFNNAIVFFHRNSPEYSAAVDLRRLFPQEIPPSATTSADGPPSRVEAEPSEAANPFKTLPVPGLPISRRRSSLTGKPPEAGKTEEAPAAEEVLASVLEWKKPIRAVMKRRSRERRTVAMPAREEGKGTGDGGVAAEGAKGGGFNKRSGSGNNGSLLETLKGLSEVCGGGGGARQGKGGRGPKEEGEGEKVVPRKRGVGRPPKKALPPAAVAQKRVREGGVEGDENMQSQRWRKRLRK